MKKYEYTGTLQHNGEGRYSISDGYYWTSGEPIEIFFEGEWLKGRIEYSHEYKDYYFCNDEKGIYVYDLASLQARI